MLVRFCGFVRWRLAYVVFVVAMGVPLLMHAQSIALPALAWDAPATCPDREQVRDTLQRWLRRAVETVDASSLEVDARVRADGSRWALTLLLKSPSGRASEQFAADDCATLVEVMGLKVTLAASAAAALHLADAASDPAIDHGASAHGGSGPRASLRATLGLAVGQVPEPTGTVGLAAALSWAAFRFELGAGYALPRAKRYAEPRGVGADFESVSGQLRGCVVVALEPAELPVCGGVELGALIGSGLGEQLRFSRAETYGLALLGPALRWPVARAWALWGELDGTLAFIRPELRTRGLGLLYRPPALGLRAIIGLELQF